MFSALMELQNPSGIPPPAGGTLTPRGTPRLQPPWRTARFFRPCTGLRRRKHLPGNGESTAASRIARPASSRHDASPPFARKNRAGKAAGWHRPRRRNSEALAGRPLSPSLRPRPAKVGARLPNASPFPQNTIKKEKRTAPDLERCQLADNLESPFYELSKMRGEWPREFSSSRLYHATNNRLDTRSTLLKPLWLFCSTPRLRGKLGPRASGYTKHKLECDVKIIIMKRRHVTLHNLQRLCGFH